MTSESKEIVLTSGGSSVRLPILKSVERPGSSTYVVPLPGIAPPGTHVSFHPFGEVHVKARDIGTLARGNLSGLRRAAEDGTIDKAFAAMLPQPRKCRSAQAVIVPTEWASRFSLRSGDGNLPIDEFILAIHPVKFGDTRHLASDLRLLRKVGYLRPRDMMLFSAGGDELVFINVEGDRPLDLPVVELPPDIPFRRTALAALPHLREYGGLFIRFPEGAALDRAAERLGLGGLTIALFQLDQIAKVTGWDVELQSKLGEIERMLKPTLSALVPNRPMTMRMLRRRKATKVLALRPKVANESLSDRPEDPFIW